MAMGGMGLCLEDAAEPLQFRGRPEAYSLVETNEMLYVGDSLVDAETAKAAKIPFVACTWGFCTEQQLRTAQPNYMIQHPSELLNIL